MLDKKKTYAALAAPFPEEAIERTDGAITGRGYSTTGIKYQFVVNRLLDEATLMIRGELGKSKQERRGRAIPISRHLVAVLRAWGPRPGEYIVVASRGRGGDREHIARQRALRDAWVAAGVREEVWLRRPSHALRKGFVSELKRSGADVEAVEFLVGHSIGLRGVYTDPTALPLRTAVDLVPPLAPPPEGTAPASMVWWERIPKLPPSTAVDKTMVDAQVVKLVDVAQHNSTRVRR